MRAVGILAGLGTLPSMVASRATFSARWRLARTRWLIDSACRISFSIATTSIYTTS